MSRRILAILGVALLASACRQVPRGAPAPTERMLICAADDCARDDDVEVTYLGVAGILVRAHGKSLLTAPHFTNPPLGSIAANILGVPREVKPDTALVRRLFPERARNASAILVGHGHYDHLLDIPFITRELATEATVYGGPSIRNMLLGDYRLNSRVTAIDTTDIGDAGRMGRWFTTKDGAFRFMALRSNHAPAFRNWLFRWSFAKGTVEQPLDELPRLATEWKLGEVYAYLIDVLGADGRPAFRIYYQDAAASSPYGHPPAEVMDRRVDLAILTVPNATDVRPRSPDALLEVIRPRYVIASHWENFFEPQTQQVGLNPADDFDAWNESMREHLPPDAEWSTPYPMTRYRFRLAGASR